MKSRRHAADLNASTFTRSSAACRFAHLRGAGDRWHTETRRGGYVYHFVLFDCAWLCFTILIGLRNQLSYGLRPDQHIFWTNLFYIKCRRVR